MRNGIMIASSGSGSGKTLLTCALLQALKTRGVKVCAYKTGPDYIDPMFHRFVLEIQGGNLDTFFTNPEETKCIFEKETSEDSFAVVEGVMGLYDGVGGMERQGSSYELASALKLPILLVVNAKGMGRSLIALLKGFLDYDKEHLIAGIILNRIGQSFYPILSKAIEEEVQLPVLGYLTEQKEMHLESRHLGLKLPGEKENLQEVVQQAAAALEESVDVERILKMGTRILPDKVDTERVGNSEETKTPVNPSNQPILAVARDEAFCFYYEENLQMLRDVGFHIETFSPIHDRELPKETKAILLGGGYPELYAKELSENQSMKNAIREAIDNKIVTVAECGGFLYLQEEIIDEGHHHYPMVGVIPAIGEYQGRSVRFGYVSICEKESIFLPKGESIRGHEFHYFDSTQNGNCCIATKPSGTKQWDCVMESEHYWWGFPHLYYPSNPHFVEYFYKTALQERKQESNQQTRMQEKIATNETATNETNENSSRYFENLACKYYPCHKGIEHMNCLFCYCPFYTRQKCPGNPYYKEKNGKPLKVCTNCTFPHQPRNYDKIIQFLTDSKME